MRWIIIAIVLVLGCKSDTSNPGDGTITYPPIPDPPVVDPGTDLSLVESQLVTSHNQQRPSVAALRVSSKLMQAAAYQAEWMAETNKMSHSGRNGSTMSDRIRKFSYNFRSAGENVASTSQENTSQVMQMWMNSSGHRKNIENVGYTEIGVAVRKGSSGQYYWCVVFGHPNS